MGCKNTACISQMARGCKKQTKKQRREAWTGWALRQGGYHFSKFSRVHALAYLPGVHASAPHRMPHGMQKYGMGCKNTACVSRMARGCNKQPRNSGRREVDLRHPVLTNTNPRRQFRSVEHSGKPPGPGAIAGGARNARSIRALCGCLRGSKPSRRDPGTRWEGRLRGLRGRRSLNTAPN